MKGRQAFQKTCSCPVGAPPADKNGGAGRLGGGRAEEAAGLGLVPRAGESLSEHPVIGASSPPPARLQSASAGLLHQAKLFATVGMCDGSWASRALVAALQPRHRTAQQHR